MIKYLTALIGLVMCVYTISIPAILFTLGVSILVVSLILITDKITLRRIDAKIQ